MITMQIHIWILALALALVAGLWDWRTRRIPNWLTVPALALGIGMNSVAAGWGGTKTALAGGGLALALLLPLVLLRTLGAGDWKLMGALGAFLGPRQLLAVLLATLLVAGLMAVVQVTWLRRWKTTLRNIIEITRGFFYFGPRAHPVFRLDNPAIKLGGSQLLTLPFGVGVALATLICFGIFRFGGI